MWVQYFICNQEESDFVCFYISLPETQIKTKEAFKENIILHQKKVIKISYFVMIYLGKNKDN